MVQEGLILGLDACTPTSETPALTRLESMKSIIRNRPPIGDGRQALRCSVSSRRSVDVALSEQHDRVALFSIPKPPPFCILG